MVEMNPRYLEAMQRWFETPVRFEKVAVLRNLS